MTRAHAAKNNLVRLNKKGKRSHRHQEGKPISQVARGAKPKCILKGVGGAGKCAEIHLAYNQFSRTRLEWLRVDLTEEEVCSLLQLTTGLKISWKKEGRRMRPYILSTSFSLRDQGCSLPGRFQLAHPGVESSIFQSTFVSHCKISTCTSWKTEKSLKSIKRYQNGAF